MLSLNEVTLMGHVGTVDSTAPLKFRLATTRTWKERDSGDVQSETEWHRITVWDPHPRLVQRLAKGARVYAAGRIHYSEYKAGGQKRTGTEIVAPSSKVEVLQAPPDPEPGQPPDQSWQARPAQDGDAYSS